MLSPSNTYGGLTNDDSIYPAGARSFFRIAARDDLEASAQVELAKQLGHHRVFFLTSAWREYGEFYEKSVRKAAERLDVEIVGLGVFDHEAESFDGLAREIAAKQPDAVAIAAVLSSGSGALVRELHAALGPDVPIFAPDGFRLIDEVVKLTGQAAKRLYVSEYGIANDKLPPRGRQFLDAFAAAGGDAGPDLSASYGAQGAEILLDAIARSDGTRASVLEEIRRTRIENGILGDIAFGPTGRPRRGAVYLLPGAGWAVRPRPRRRRPHAAAGRSVARVRLAAMGLLTSEVARDETFEQRRTTMEGLVAELRERTAHVAAGGGEKALERHRSRGKFTARERIDRLVDPGARLPRAQRAGSVGALRRRRAVRRDRHRHRRRSRDASAWSSRTTRRSRAAPTTRSR